MKKFNIEAADSQGHGHSFTIKPLKNERYRIFNEQHVRVATIEIDNQDPEHYRQSLDCSVDLFLLNAIKDGILLHDGVLAK
ncbi:MAG: hypothetical protein P0Y49_14715 [Candidatus Pedobacter colombiensis]|uniref:Uncharacterized protein n=1 Tax=Candidatus Pedobacter colombiensis TaxID=3121371 RepID=A0AAJ6B5D0_9SPHI|nr:hypothetical protein [Pedobacter sp.]WEK18045.1 MAG: hypothetical protein P0Y49_14715 [Pedobacter sp.]